MDCMFDFAEKINNLRLSDAEIGLFCSMVVIATDRPGLRNIELVERMHNKLRNALQMIMSQNHPGQPNICNELMKKIPDLRTLNTLHSEKLLAFKMTEQQQLHQAAMQQEMMWTDEEAHKSPTGSWSTSSDVTMDEAKSPLGSVSSSESVCSGEVAALTEYHPSHVPALSGHAASAPLLAATLAGCPRHRANSGSTSGDDDVISSHLIQNGLTITAVGYPNKSYGLPHHRFQRKLDSPSDSGIESGTEKIEKVTNSVNSAPTSLCSSPRSSFEDKDDEKHGHIDDMPVLKRVLQAPPLYDTNSLMDEAYKPHKKFRAMRPSKDSAEAEPMVASPGPEQSSPTLHRHLTSSLSSTHSTLAKSLSEGPRMTAEQVKRQDMIHSFIMREESEVPRGFHYLPTQPPPSRWRPNCASVITTAHLATSSCPSPIASPSPRLQLQVDIADSQQPLNLSKKSPSPSPRPMSAPSSTVLKLEA